MFYPWVLHLFWIITYLLEEEIIFCFLLFCQSWVSCAGSYYLRNLMSSLATYKRGVFICPPNFSPLCSSWCPSHTKQVIVATIEVPFCLIHTVAWYAQITSLLGNCCFLFYWWFHKVYRFVLRTTWEELALRYSIK